MPDARACIAGVAMLLGAAGAAAAEPAQDGAGGVRFSGHYKNMLLGSRTLLGGQERYTLDASRLRLEWKGQWRPGLGVEVQYDNEVLVGDYLRTRQFALESALPRRTYFDLEGDTRGETMRWRAIACAAAR